jgi:membrane fusion protein, multidrug efflux system
MARRWSDNRLYLGGAIGLVALAVIAALIVHGRTAEVATTRDLLESAAARGPRVQVVMATKSPESRNVRLLGDARPYVTATIFTKVAGYLKSVSVDKGDQVKSGQVLGEIDSAETDALYDAALADRDNKKKLADRDRDLLTRGNVSQQSQQQSETNLRMAEQNVRNLATVKSYEIIRAPFDGTVTARYADPGALMTAASSLPILTISDTSKLRIGAYVEQRDVPFVHVGDAVDISDASDAERTVRAQISRTAGALDPKTRTLYIEIDVDNSQNFLIPGSFAYVQLHLQVKSYPQIPVSALIVRGEQNYVAAVDADGMVKLRAIRIASTDGDNVAVNDGVQPGDRVAINLPPEITDGSRIQPVLASK